MNETLKEDAWTKIFTDAGIDATDAAKYAKIFVSQKMSRGAINQLDRALLTEMGITEMGILIIGPWNGHQSVLHREKIVEHVIKVITSQRYAGSTETERYNLKKMLSVWRH